MSRRTARARWTLLEIAAVACVLASRPAAAAPATPAFATPGPCRTTVLETGASTLICIPASGWNGSLVLFAHGVVDAGARPAFAHLELRDGTKLPALVQRLGFAFATTTYRRSGPIALDGVDDVVDVVERWPSDLLKPDRVYLAGVSDGALVATLAAEQRPDLFTAALATCGPIGSYQLQVNHVGDFRVLFDAMFPGVLPGSVAEVPAAVRAAWTSQYVPAIRAALDRDVARARELVTVAHVPFDPARPASIADGAVNLLREHVFGAAGASARFGGRAFGNRFRWYSGSANDLLLNLRVARVDPDVTALLEVRKFTPSGDLQIPLVVLHTSGDELVPAEHAAIYAARSRTTRRGQVLPLAVPRWGHCEFETSELLTGFALMLSANPPRGAEVSVASARLPGFDGPIAGR